MTLPNVADNEVTLFKWPHKFNWSSVMKIIETVITVQEVGFHDE